MCLILFAKNQHPRYKLIVAANRDEFYGRKTKAAHYWESHPHILAGKDLEAGGSWMGITKDLQLAMLTNFRDPSNIDPDAPSRGDLVLDFLKNRPDPKDYLEKKSNEGHRYNGFNLICGSPDALYYYGNYQDGVHEISDGIHGLSNALLNTEWPKIRKGKQHLAELLQSEKIETNDLFELLYDDNKASPEDLPDTGVGMDKELMLSPMFIKSGQYGSRCSTLYLVDRENRALFVERTYNVQEFSYTDKKFKVEKKRPKPLST